MPSRKTETGSKRYSLYEDIKSHELYKKRDRDVKAREMIEEELSGNKRARSKTQIFPGQLVLFKYLNPLTRDELEYYDASPLTIFFGIANTKEGRRVIGFNIHYFPTNLRFVILDRIYEIYRPIYQKYFESGLAGDIDAFDYRYLMEELDKWDMAWAVRMYIPARMGEVRCITPSLWSTAVFTEGWFRKETRSTIMNYWKKRAQGYRPKL